MKAGWFSSARAPVLTLGMSSPMKRNLNFLKQHVIGSILKLSSVKIKGI